MKNEAIYKTAKIYEAAYLMSKCGFVLDGLEPKTERLFVFNLKAPNQADLDNVDVLLNQHQLGIDDTVSSRAFTNALYRLKMAAKINTANRRNV